MLYWTDVKTTNPAIYRSPVVNSARDTVISGSLEPTALAVDFTGKEMAKVAFSLRRYIVINGDYRRSENAT